MTRKNLQWGFFKSNGEVEYLPVQGKIDLFIPARPLRELMCFKNPTMNDWIVADFRTGLKIGGFRTRKAAKDAQFNDDTSREVVRVLGLQSEWGRVFPEVNQP